MKKYIVGVLIWCSVTLPACHKKNEDASYTTRIAIAHFVPNADSVSVLYDGNRIGGTRALTYGNVTTQNGLAYLTLSSGTHNTRILAGTRVVRDNIYTYIAGKYYSLFLYDSLKNNTVKAALIQDAVLPVDTLVKVRLINMIADTSKIYIKFSKDTTTQYTSDTYLGTRSNLSYPFYSLRPGSWKVSLERSGAVIVQPAAFDLQAGKIYSFVARGVKGGTGVYAENVLLMKHN